MADKLKDFQVKVHDLIPGDGERNHLFEALRQYQMHQDLHVLLLHMRQLLDEPQKLELYEFIRPLIMLRHQMEYSYLAPAVPGVRLRTVRLHRQPGQSLGFAVRGGYEYGVGVFVSVVEPGSQAEKQGLKVGDEIVRVNGFTIAEAIHEDVLNLIKSRDEIILRVTHIGMLPIKEHVSQAVTWQYVEDMDSKVALAQVLERTKQVKKAKLVELKIFIDCTGYDSIGCGILSGPNYYPGIFVEKVRPGSLAQEAGLEVGDQLVEVNETSFLNVDHKEAVVVLKGNKQLNVILRKHAGLPLFERRQQASSSRSSQASGSSDQFALTSVPSSQSATRSRQPVPDSNGLDEGQLIAEQLSRGFAFGQVGPRSPDAGKSASTSQFSLQADVHSGSDSTGTSSKRVPRIPVEEFSALELDGRELCSFVFPKNQDLGIQLEGGIGTPLGGKIVIASVFDGGAAVEHGLQTGDQLMMVNGHKVLDITVSQAEQILGEAYKGPKDMIHLVYAQSSFLNDEECLTYF